MKLPMLISITLSIAMIIVIIYFTFTEETISELSTKQIKYEYFIVALLVNFIYWIMWGARLKVLSNALDENVKISLWESSKIIMANLFLANITPSMAGGEPVRIYLLNKNGLSTGSATAAVLGERLLDAIFLLICFPFAFLVFSQLFENDIRLKIALFVAVAVFIFVILAFVYTIKKPETIKSVVIWINNKIIRRFSKKKESQSKVVKRINREVDNFHDGMVLYLTKRKMAFVKGFLLTAGFWIVGWTIPILILMGLGLGPHIIESSAAQIILIIIVMLPTTPGSAGVTEFGATGIYSVFIGGFAGVFTLIFRILTFYFGFIVGTIFMHKIFKSVASFSMDQIKKEEKE